MKRLAIPTAAPTQADEQSAAGTVTGAPCPVKP